MTTSTKSGSKVYITYVDQWLDTLPAADSEDFREFAEVTPSVIEIWVYAGILQVSRYIQRFSSLGKNEVQEA